LLLFAGAKVLIFIINYETFVEKAQNLKKATDRKRQREGRAKAIMIKIDYPPDNNN